MARMTDAEWQAKAESWEMCLGFPIEAKRIELTDDSRALITVTLQAWSKVDKHPLFLIRESTEEEAVKNSEIAVKSIAAANAAGGMS